MLAIGSDHAGFYLKQDILARFQKAGLAYRDFGTLDGSATDTADVALAVAQAVVSGEYEQGILICGTGIGMSIAANKVPGIRAALVGDCFSAKTAREHNNANILCLGARVLGSGAAITIVDTWLASRFDGSEKRLRRIEKINRIEVLYSG